MQLYVRLYLKSNIKKTFCEMLVGYEDVFPPQTLHSDGRYGEQVGFILFHFIRARVRAINCTQTPSRLAVTSTMHAYASSTCVYAKRIYARMRMSESYYGYISSRAMAPVAVMDRAA